MEILLENKGFEIEKKLGEKKINYEKNKKIF